MAGRREGKRGEGEPLKPVDLGVEFGGLRFTSPFVLAASPSTHSGNQVRRAFDHGWAGVVWKTLGSITGVPHPKVSPCYAAQRGGGRILGLENIDQGNDIPLGKSFREIGQVKKDYPRSMLIVSLRGENLKKKWQDLARRAEDAGADMLELMFSCPMDIADSVQGEGMIGVQAQAITHWVREAVHLPIMVKMSPDVADVRIPARAAQTGGADALSATNTIRCLMGVDLKTLRPLPTVGGRSSFGGYSGPAIKPIVLRIVAQLARDPKLRLPISAIGGVATWQDAAEYILVGAGLVQVCTAAMVHGFRIIEDLRSGLELFMRSRGFSSLAEWRGLALPHLATQAELDRQAVQKARIDPARCIRCLRCFISCRDGAYGAIRAGSDRLPAVQERKCRGCSLCQWVCPVDGAVEMVPARQALGPRGAIQKPVPAAN